jgi:hypothetical protein
LTVAIAALIVALYWLTENYLVFWLSLLFYLVTSALRHSGSESPPVPVAPPPTVPDRFAVGLASVAALIIYLAAFRPDGDDTFYLSIASDALAHPKAAPMSHDGMMGAAFPFLGVFYKPGSFELLAAGVSTLTGLMPVAAMHLVIAPIFAASLLLVWVHFIRLVLPDQWRSASLITALMFLGLEHQAFNLKHTQPP